MIVENDDDDATNRAKNHASLPLDSDDDDDDEYDETIVYTYWSYITYTQLDVTGCRIGSIYHMKPLILT